MDGMGSIFALCMCLRAAMLVAQTKVSPRSVSPLSPVPSLYPVPSLPRPFASFCVAPFFEVCCLDGVQA